MIKNFDSWQEYEGASEGSGRSEKIWLVNHTTKEMGLFKFTKTEHTTEHLSEKIASQIAKLLDIECAKVDLGKYNSRIGSLSHIINRENENLIEGIQLINKYYPSYDMNILYDSQKEEYYSLEMIQKSLHDFEFKKEFYKILVFDFLIGNTDRHHSNWAILRNDKRARLCPLYDNGSSLCCYIEESKIDSYLGKDKVRFNSIVTTKSTSRIRIDKKLKKEPTHLAILEYLQKNHYEEVVDIVKKINTNINEYNIKNILEKFNTSIMSEKRKILIQKYLLEKVKLMSKQFNIRKEEYYVEKRW